MKVPAILAIVLFVAVWALPLSGLHRHLHGGVNFLQLVLAIFCAVNAWVCLCEIALYVQYSAIQAAYKSHSAKYGAGKLPPIFLFEWVTLKQIFSTHFWGVGMWATYSVLDPSYIDSTSFGWNIDVCNGITTLVPSAIFTIGMTYPVLSARWLGMLGLVLFYQQLYGTVVYFFQYFFNRRFDRCWHIFQQNPAMRAWSAALLRRM